MRNVRIHTLGVFEVNIDGVSVDLPRHAQGLIAFLASDTRLKFERRVLAELLWQGSDSARKRHSLSQLLYELDRVVSGLIWKTRDYVGLSDRAWVDAKAFRDLQVRNEIAGAIERYRGAFLEDLPYISEAFDDWRVEYAAALEHDAVRLLHEMLATCIDRDDHVQASDLARRALLLRPCDEYFAHSRVHSLAAAGDSIRALRELDYLSRKITAETGRLPASLSEGLRERLVHMPRLGEPTEPNKIQIRIVGRDDELRLLRAQLEAAQTGLRAADIRGDSGIGKTRLMQQVLRRAAVQGVRIYSYACSEAEARLPSSCIAGLVRDGFRTADVAGLNATWVQALASFTPELFPSTEAPQPLPQRILWEAVSQYFDHVSRRGRIAIAIDNVQWVDEYSLDILSYLSRRLFSSPIFMLSCGSNGAHSSLDIAVDSPKVDVELNELSPDEIEEFISCFEAVRSIRIEPAARVAINDRIGGRPFFLLQALNAVADLGGRLPVTKDVITSVLPQVASHLAARLKELPEHARDIATIVACIGRSVPITLLAAVAEVTMSSAANSLRILIRSGLIADEPTTRFSHELYRQAVLHALPEPLRAALHARIAVVMSDRATGSRGELAYHLERAGDFRAALVHSVAAARDAADIGSYTEADEQYMRAIRCASPEDSVATWSQYVRFLLRTGKIDSLEKHIHNLDSLFGANGDSLGHITSKLVRFTSAERSGVDADELLAMAKDILVLTERHAPAELSSVLWQVGDCIRRSGDRDTLARFAEVLAEQADPELGRSAVELLSAAALLGGVSIGYGFSLPLADRAVDLSRHSLDPLQRGRALFARATAYLGAGELAAASTDYRFALTLAEKAGLGSLEAIIKSNLALVLLEQDCFEEAEQIGLAAAREAKLSRRAYATGNLALIHLRKGDREGVLHYVTRLQHIHDVSPQPWIPDHGHALLGLAALAVGLVPEARRHAHSIKSNQDQVPSLIDSSPIVLLQSRIHVLDGDIQLALNLLSRAAIRAKAIDWIAHARLLLEHARVCAIHKVESDVAATCAVIASDACRKHVMSLCREAKQLR